MKRASHTSPTRVFRHSPGIAPHATLLDSCTGIFPSCIYVCMCAHGVSMHCAALRMCAEQKRMGVRPWLPCMHPLVKGLEPQCSTIHSLRTPLISATTCARRVLWLGIVRAHHVTSRLQVHDAAAVVSRLRHASSATAVNALHTPTRAGDVHITSGCATPCPTMPCHVTAACMGGAVGRMAFGVCSCSCMGMSVSTSTSTCTCTCSPASARQGRS